MFNSRNLCTNFVLVFTKNRFRRFFFLLFFQHKIFSDKLFYWKLFWRKKSLILSFLWLWHFLDGFFLETNIFCIQRNDISLAQKIIRHSNFNMLNIAYHTQLCTIFVLVNQESWNQQSPPQTQKPSHRKAFIINKHKNCA